MKAGDVKLIEQWEPDLGGVYTMSDLKVLFGSQSEAALYKKLQAFIDSGILVKVKRGIYARPNASLDPPRKGVKRGFVLHYTLPRTLSRTLFGLF